MPYVITEPCLGTKDASCYDVCPVDAIHPALHEPGFAEQDQMFIDPVACVDCGACEPVCPVEAIFRDNEVPEQWEPWIAVNRRFFEPPTADFEIRPPG